MAGSERQQLAEAIGNLINDVLYGDPVAPRDVRFRLRNDIVAIAEQHLVAAERAGYERALDELDSGENDLLRVAASNARAEGYERCKRDATKGIDALPHHLTATGPSDDIGANVAVVLRDALAVVAALNATQQEASDG